MSFRLHRSLVPSSTFCVITLRTILFEQFVDRYFPAPVAAQEPTVVTANQHARLVAGEYAWSRQQKGDFREAIGLIGRFALNPRIRANADGTIRFSVPAGALFVLWCEYWSWPFCRAERPDPLSETSPIR